MSLVFDPQCLQNSNLNIFWMPMIRQRMRNYLRLYLRLVVRNRRARLCIHISIEYPLQAQIICIVFHFSYGYIL